MKKAFVTILLVCTAALTASAQQQDPQAPHKNVLQRIGLQHLDLGVTLGTTGVGIDVAAPVSSVVTLRTGFEAMLRYDQRMHFDIQSFDDQGQQLSSNIDRLTSTMYDLTGYRVDGTIDMVGKPTMWNFKLLVDVYPFRNKHWHLTAGFHWGPSKIAEAVNAIEDSPSLFAVGMYNHLYDNAWDADHGNMRPILITGTDEDGEPDGISLAPEIIERLLATGRMGIHVGDYKHDVVDADGNVVHQAGEAYRMEPDEHSMVTARVKTNSFKPYLGFGYGGRLLKKSDKYGISFDAGLMFWGGTPDVITHDGTNLTKDVQDISGKVGDYVDLIKGVKAYPVLNLRITRRLF